MTTFFIQDGMHPYPRPPHGNAGGFFMSAGRYARSAGGINTAKSTLEILQMSNPE